MKYGCHTTGPATPLSDKTPPLTVQTGWTDDGRRITREHHAVWMPVMCGHNESGTDACCDGCTRRNT